MSITDVIDADYEDKIEQLKAELATAKEGNERLRALYCEHMLCQDCGKPFDNDMFICDKGKPFTKIKADNQRLREAFNHIPVDEYSRAQREGLDSSAAWDSFLEVLAEWKEHVLKEVKP